MSNALQNRDNWQKDSSLESNKSENDLFDSLSKDFEGTKYEIRKKPKELENIYRNFELPEDVKDSLGKDILDQIYHQSKKYNRHGVVIDYAIDNIETNKRLYLENKQQAGWVIGGNMSDGRGNAHERGFKFWTPGLQEALRNHGNLHADAVPFWIVYQGGITLDPKRVNEIYYCFGERHRNHCFLWFKNNPHGPSDHFIKHLSYLLD